MWNLNFHRISLADLLFSIFCEQQTTIVPQNFKNVIPNALLSNMNCPNIYKLFDILLFIAPDVLLFLKLATYCL